MRRSPSIPECEGAMQHGSAVQPANAGPEFLVGRMRVDRRGERAHMPSEPLRQEQVPRGAVDIRDRRVAFMPSSA